MRKPAIRLPALPRAAAQPWIPSFRSTAEHRQSVAVLACDPQSPVSGGALLGDRFRMGAAPDDGVFIRSLATAGGRGAVAEHLGVMVRLLEAFGFDLILLETVGAGQGDVAVAGLADAVRRLQAVDWPLRQLTDHGTHEAVYISDPDGNDVELYWDRPPEQWPVDDQGRLAFAGGDLDLDDLLR